MCGIPSSRNGSDFWINPTFSYNSFAYTCASILIDFVLNSSFAVLISSLKVVPGGRMRAYA